MKYLIYTIFLLIILALNNELTALFFSTPIRLNLLLLPVVFAALEKHNNIFMFLAFVAGLLLDFYNSGPFGSFLFSFIIIAWGVNFLAKTAWVYEPSWKMVAVFTLAAGIFLEFIYRLLGVFLPGRESYSLGLVFQSIWPAALYRVLFNLILAFPMFSLWRAVVSGINRLETKNTGLK